MSNSSTSKVNHSNADNNNNNNSSSNSSNNVGDNSPRIHRIILFFLMLLLCSLALAKFLGWAFALLLAGFYVERYYTHYTSEKAPKKRQEDEAYRLSLCFLISIHTSCCVLYPTLALFEVGLKYWVPFVIATFCPTWYVIYALDYAFHEKVLSEKMVKDTSGMLKYYSPLIVLIGIMIVSLCVLLSPVMMAAMFVITAYLVSSGIFNQWFSRNLRSSTMDYTAFCFFVCHCYLTGVDHAQVIPTFLVLFAPYCILVLYLHKAGKAIIQSAKRLVKIIMTKYVEMRILFTLLGQFVEFQKKKLGNIRFSWFRPRKVSKKTA